MHDERELPAVTVAARDRHVEQAIEAAAVVETGERVVPRVVAHDVEAQREHAQREHERAVEVVVLERGLRVEAGRRDEQLVVLGAERPAAGAEDLAADLALLEHDGGVFEGELLDERVERAVDERDPRVGGRDGREELVAGVGRRHRSTGARGVRVEASGRGAGKDCRQSSAVTRLLRHRNPPWYFPAARDTTTRPLCAVTSRRSI